MKIKIDASSDKDIEIEFSDAELNNDNFVDMCIEDKDYTFSVDDLYSAVVAFKTQREERLKRELLLK